jgi:hypothetical protein
MIDLEHSVHDKCDNYSLQEERVVAMRQAQMHKYPQPMDSFTGVCSVSCVQSYDL